MASFKRLLLLIVLVLVMVALSAALTESKTDTGAIMRATVQAATSPGPTDPVELAAFFDDVMPKSLVEYQVPGSVVTVVRERQVLFSKGYGYANVEAQLPVSPETSVFRIGSISKLFVWTSVMQLVEQGRLDPDADINQYLDFKIPVAFDQAITLKHLMCHSAGFEESNYETRATSPETLIPLGTWLKTHLPTRVRPPGLISVYSNYGTDLAAYIVERTSKTAYGKYVEQHILEPLGMSHTTALQLSPGSRIEPTPIGYAFVQKTFQVSPYEYAHAAPSGFMNATGADMARFMIAHLNDGEYQGNRILRAETVEQMRSRLLTADPRINGFRYGFYDMRRNGVEIYGHGGDTTAFHSILALFPAQDMAVFLSYNGVGKPLMQENMLAEFVDRYFPAPPPPTPNPALKDAPRVAGLYRSMRSSYTSMEKVLWLLGSADVQAMPDGSIRYNDGLSGPRTLVEVEPLMFRQVDSDSTVVFRANAQGEILAAFDSANPPRPLERYPWYENPSLHLAILGVGYLLMLSALLVGLIGVFRRRRTPQPLAARITRYTLIAAALLAFAFVILFPIDSSSQLAFTQGQVAGFIVPLLCSTLVAVLTPFVLIGAVLAWQRGFWSVATRIHYTLAAVALVGITYSLFTWNLVGWRF